MDAASERESGSSVGWFGGMLKSWVMPECCLTVFIDGGAKALINNDGDNMTREEAAAIKATTLGRPIDEDNIIISSSGVLCMKR